MGITSPSCWFWKFQHNIIQRRHLFSNTPWSLTKVSSFIPTVVTQVYFCIVKRYRWDWGSLEWKALQAAVAELWGQDWGRMRHVLGHFFDFWGISLNFGAGLNCNMFEWKALQAAVAKLWGRVGRVGTSTKCRHQVSPIRKYNPLFLPAEEGCRG